MKFWIKLFKEHQIIKDGIYETTLDLTFPSYEEMLPELSALLDISTPLYLKADFIHLRKYGIQKYKQSSFVENIDFDYLEIERLKSENKKSTF